MDGPDHTHLEEVPGQAVSSLVDNSVSWKRLLIFVYHTVGDDEYNEMVEFVQTSHDIEELHLLMIVDDWEYLGGVLEAAMKNKHFKAITLKKCVIRTHKDLEEMLVTKNRVSLDHCHLPYTKSKNLSRFAKKVCEAIQASGTLKSACILGTFDAAIQIQMLNALRSCPMIYRLSISVKSEEMVHALASFLEPTPGVMRSNFLILTLNDSIFDRDICTMLVQAMVGSEMEVILVLKKSQWPGKGELTQVGFFWALRRNLRVNIVIVPGDNMSEDHAEQLMAQQNDNREVQIYRQSVEYTFQDTNQEDDLDKAHDAVLKAFSSDDYPLELESYFESKVTEAFAQSNHANQVANPTDHSAVATCDNHANQMANPTDRSAVATCDNRANQVANPTDRSAVATCDNHSNQVDNQTNSSAVATCDNHANQVVNPTNSSAVATYDSHSNQAANPTDSSAVATCDREASTSTEAVATYRATRWTKAGRLRRGR